MRIVSTLIAAILCVLIVMVSSSALGFGGTIGKQKVVAIKGADEHGLHSNTAGGTTALSNGQKATTNSVSAGSSEHSSVRGTINGGGDFIAPKLKENAPKPRGVAPKAPQ